MSTEAPSPADLEKKRSKKRKKEKDPNDSMSKKKVKAAEAEDGRIGQTTDTPKMKDKKRKDKDVSTCAPTAPSSDELLNTHSPFVTQTTSFYLALSPCAHDFALEGLCAEHISPLLLTYYPPLNGVVLSYSNPRVSEHAIDALQTKSNDERSATLARSINEYAVTYTWLTADFLLFRPRKGAWLEGYVSLQNESLLGLMCYNYFNAVIPREMLPKGWRWEGETNGLSGKNTRDMHDENGYFVDADGTKIDGRIVFQVDDFNATPGSDGVGGTVSITGTLRSDNDNDT